MYIASEDGENFMRSALPETSGYGPPSSDFRTDIIIIIFHAGILNIIDIRNNSKEIQREKNFIQIKFIQPVPYRVKFKVYSTYRVKNNGYMMSNKI